MFVFKAAVVGAGTMGGQIAQSIAAAGFPVVLKDIRQELVDHGLTEARNVTQGQVAKMVSKGKLTEEQGAAQVEEIVGRIEGTTSYEGFGDVDFVIEAVPEVMAIKQAVFAELDAVTPGHAILASNTSSLSVTEIGDATLRPDQVVGFHYFYPASVMPLIEVIEGDDTSQETTQTAVNFAQAIKKQPITSADVPGFVVNRILNAGIRDLPAPRRSAAFDQVHDEAVGAQNVTPMPPFFLIDLLGSTRSCTAPSTKEMTGPLLRSGHAAAVADGKLGRKRGGAGLHRRRPNPKVRARRTRELATLLKLKSIVRRVSS